MSYRKFHIREKTLRIECLFFWRPAANPDWASLATLRSSVVILLNLGIIFIEHYYSKLTAINRKTSTCHADLRRHLGDCYENSIMLVRQVCTVRLLAQLEHCLTSATQMPPEVGMTGAVMLCLMKHPNESVRL